MNLEDIEQEPLVLKPEGIKAKKVHSKGFKILIICGIAGFVVWILAACWCVHYMSENYKPVSREERKAAKEEQRKEEVLAYLEDRYGEEFEIASYREMSYAYDYVKMYAYPKGYSDEAHRFQIQGRLNEDGEMEYADSYVMVKLTDDYEAYIDPIIGEYFDDYKFYLEFNSEWITSNLPPDTQLEDLWELHANEDYPLPSLYISLAPNQENDNYITRQLCTDLRDSGLRGRVKIWWVKEEYRYEKLSRNNWEKEYNFQDYDDMLTIFLYEDKIKIMEEEE